MSRGRSSGRPKDALQRKRFERLPLWVRFLAWLPFAFWYAMSSICAWLGEYLVHYRRKVVDGQIRRCFPEFDDATVDRTRRAFYRNFADVMIESVKALTIEGEELDRRVELVGLEAVRAHIAAGRSAVLVTSHNCNWEWTLQAISHHMGGPMDAAYKPLHDALPDRLFLTLRARFGATMIADRRLLMHLLRRRHQPRAIAMVADQYPTGKAARHLARFFGRDTVFFFGPEAVARALGCPIFYVSVVRKRRGYYRVSLELLVGHDEDLPKGAMIDRYAARVEAQIRAHPPDWLWAYRRWKKRAGDPASTV